MDSYNCAYDIMDDAYINNRPDADITSDSAWERHAEDVKELIASAKKIPYSETILSLFRLHFYIYVFHLYYVYKMR